MLPEIRLYFKRKGVSFRNTSPKMECDVALTIDDDLWNLIKTTHNDSESQSEYYI